MSIFRWYAVFILMVMLTAGCAGGPQTLAVPAGTQNAPIPTAPVTVTRAPLAESGTCQNTFIPHTLSFATGYRMRDIATYASNGAGLAINDLDGDGDMDLVFANVDGESTILWNQGDLKFKEESLKDSFTRGVNIVDVDGDGRPDITFTHRGLESVSFWRNTGPGGNGAIFEQADLPGVTYHAYAMGWADLNQDGSLDLVTGSYNTDLRQSGLNANDLAQSAGLVYYSHRGNKFIPSVLDPKAETLSVALFV